ncbi:MAG: hypothetical protein CVV51_06875, partial [Spirochaetae bacterium HGW-Spirochaetae-7]
MQKLIESLSPEAIWLSVAGATALTIIVIVLVREIGFRRAVRKAATQPAFPAIGRVTLSFRERYIVKRSRRGFIGTPGPFPGLPEKLGYHERWMEAVKARHSRGAAARLLEFAPARGLFECFVAALSYKAIADDLLG